MSETSKLMQRILLITFVMVSLSVCNSATGESVSDSDPDGDEDDRWVAEFLMPRDVWRAKPPTSSLFMRSPVPYVIIHHSYIPAACYEDRQCEGAVRAMQRMHQVTNGWDDIGYTFAVGGNGKVYYGRGWNLQGAHAPTYNNQSIGICLMGDWRTEVPPPSMLGAAKKLIKWGTRRGYVATDYKLYGHRQVRVGTECPGDALMNEISTWDHWDDKPPHLYRPH